MPKQKYRRSPTSWLRTAWASAACATVVRMPKTFWETCFIQASRCFISLSLESLQRKTQAECKNQRRERVVLSLQIHWHLSAHSFLLQSTGAHLARSKTKGFSNPNDWGSSCSDGRQLQVLQPQLNEPCPGWNEVPFHGASHVRWKKTVFSPNWSHLDVWLRQHQKKLLSMDSMPRKQKLWPGLMAHFCTADMPLTSGTNCVRKNPTSRSTLAPVSWLH